ncbi:Bro-N domain-containing protein [Edwardsiella tarda]|uniref:BRO-N domain-containing protein n=1 Tax=Edwardsiella tarda TaxID=636 RepID=UPI003B5092C6
MPTLNVATMSFAGQSLRVITGYDKVTGNPQHELLFIAKQVVDAAGLKNGSQAISMYAKQGGRSETFLRVGDLMGDYNKIIDTIIDYPTVQRRSYLFTEAQAYTVLLRGHSPASSTFRKWVTEEVLPTIRKTGSYNVEESTTEEGKMFSAEFAAMREEKLIKYNLRTLTLIKEVTQDWHKEEQKCQAI